MDVNSLFRFFLWKYSSFFSFSSFVSFLSFSLFLPMFLTSHGQRIMITVFRLFLWEDMLLCLLFPSSAHACPSPSFFFSYLLFKTIYCHWTWSCFWVFWSTDPLFSGSNAQETQNPHWKQKKKDPKIRIQMIIEIFAIFLKDSHFSVGFRTKKPHQKENFENFLPPTTSLIRLNERGSINLIMIKKFECPIN